MPTLQKAADAAEISADKPTAAPVTNFILCRPHSVAYGARTRPAEAACAFAGRFFRYAAPSSLRGRNSKSGADAFCPSRQGTKFRCHAMAQAVRPAAERGGNRHHKAPSPRKGGDGVLQALTSPSDPRRQCGQACSDTSWRSSPRTCWPACLPVRRRRPCLPRGRGRRAFRPAHWGSSWDNRR